MPNDMLKYTKKILLLSENVLEYEKEGSQEKIKPLLKKINILAKDLRYVIHNEKPEQKQRISTTAQQKEAYLEDLKLTNEQIKKYVKSIKEPVKKQKTKYQEIYKSSSYAKLSNIFMENLAFKLIKKNPDRYKNLFFNLRSADIRILSETYLSIILFSTIISFPIALLIVFLLTFNIILSIFLAMIAPVLIFYITYKYPELAKIERGKKIKQELVFAIVHMSAVAGSGAHPIKIFELLVDSGEYKEIEGELRGVLNYINLFGYSLSTSLKIVAHTTPSNEFKELLYGMTSTIETGGDIKDYLKEKADDALIQYKFSQQKQLEALATYSDVYTGILIAAPLLFIVTLAILEKISPEIAGIPISLISNLSVFVALPLLNIFYILFLQSVRSEI